MHSSFTSHVTSTKMSCELSKVTSQSTVSWELNSAFRWSPVHPPLFEVWFRRLHLWLWGTRKIFGGIMKMMWESKPRKLGAENPVIIWLKEVTDVQGINGWHFLSWIPVQCFSLLTISLAFSSWKPKLHVTMNGSGVQRSCMSPAAVGTWNKPDWALLQRRVRSWEETSTRSGLKWAQHLPWTLSGPY